jgi:hypothetical protein
MEKFNLSADEEKALIGLLYNHLCFGATLEVFGELKEGGSQRLDILRGAFVKLLNKYALIDNLTQEDYLLLGLKDLLKKESLAKWLANEKNKHLQIRAKYFKDRLS